MRLAPAKLGEPVAEGDGRARVLPLPVAIWMSARGRLSAAREVSRFWMLSICTRAENRSVFSVGMSRGART